MKYISSLLLVILLFIVVVDISHAATDTIKIYAGSGDGVVGVGTPEALSIWAGAREYSGVVSYVLDDTSPYAMGLAQFIQPYDTYRIYRSSLPFDTSLIPDDAEIHSATLHLYGSSEYGLQEIPPCIVTHDRTDMLELNWEDYYLNKFGSTELANVNGSLINNQYNIFDLNETGLAYINSFEGIAIGIRAQNDCMGIDPGPGHDRYSTAWNSSEAEGTSTDPYLEVTYSYEEDEHTPEELITELQQIVENEIGEGPIQNAYKAHVKKLLEFYTRGQMQAFSNQLKTLLKKTDKDLGQGELSPALAGEIQAIVAELLE